MEKAKFRLCLLFLYFLFLIKVYCTTHWLLTEDGHIQAQMDSIFQLRRPYDFLALSQQEQRAQQVEALKKELLKQKAHIDQNEDKDTQLEERIYKTYSDCVLAGRPLTEFDLYASTVVSLENIDLNLEDYLGDPPGQDEVLLEPECTLAYDLPFSMYALDHLSGIRFRHNLTATPEEDLHVLLQEEDPDIWGHQVAVGLSKNASAWVLYTIATQFWRVKGNAANAMECVRRALYFSTRQYRHIPLVHLGNILHRSQKSQEAAIAFHMALDHNKHSTATHMSLGNVYTTLAYYNVSVLCYDNALYMEPKNEGLRKLKHAVLCHAYLESALEKQHQSLQRTLNELREYRKKHEEWLNLQQKLLLEQATPEMKLESRLEYEEQKIRESTDGRGQDCFQYQQDGHTFLSCNMRRDQLEHRGSPSELLLDLTSLLNSVESEALRLGQHVFKRKPFVLAQVPTVHRLQPLPKEKSAVFTSHPSKLFGKDFPSAEVCESSVPLPQWDEFPTVFLPPENKGYNMTQYLSDDIGIPMSQTIPKPHQLPICERFLLTVAEVDDLPTIKDRHSFNLRYPDPTAKQFLLRYGSQESEGEIGHRIALAMYKFTGPQWLLLNLAGLFWRAHGNLFNGIECLRHSVFLAPANWLDVPLVNLAALLYTAGHIDDALTLAKRASEINDHEADSNFLLANLYCGKGNLSGAWQHYEKVLELDPNHTFALQYLTALACHIHSSTMHSLCPHQGSQNGESCEAAGCMTDFEDESVFMPLESNELAEGEEDDDDDGDDDGNDESSDEDSVKTSLNDDSSRNSPLNTPYGPENKSVSGSHGEVSMGLSDDETPEQSESSDVTGLIQDDPLPDVLLRVRERISSSPPPPHACEHMSTKLSEMNHFTSTWLSASAKNVGISEYLVEGLPDSTPMQEPICEEIPASMHTLDHLSGVRHRERLMPYPETGLQEALQTLVDRVPVSVEAIATRIAKSLERNQSSWVVATAAALYWRVTGNSFRTVNCLRLALHHAPRQMKDVPLISLANVLHRAGLYNNALVVANMALEISPKLVVIHFTMANIYAAKGDLGKATAFYQSTLTLQPSFEPARERLRAIQCASLSERTFL